MSGFRDADNLQQGFSLVEVMAALCLFSIFALSLYNLLLQNAALVRSNKTNEQLLQEALKEIEYMRVIDAGNLPGGERQTTIEVYGQKYQRLTSIQPTGEGLLKIEVNIAPFPGIPEKFPEVSLVCLREP